MSSAFSLSDVKKELGPGLGIRSNLYLLECAIKGADARKLAVLCLSTSLPERNIGKVDLFHKGRKYTIRGETELTGTYTINITDDSEMKLRRYFDSWMKEVDNTTPKTENALAGLIGGEAGDFMESVNGVIKAVNSIKSAWQVDGGLSWIKNTITGKNVPAGYMTNVNIWQLSKTRQKLRGYALQGCFPIELGAIETDDSNENQLSQFSVTFAYSDFEPITNDSFMKQVVDTIIGETGQEILRGTKNLFG